MGEVVEVTGENFQELVADGQSLVDVWGPQCAPCLALNPHVEKLAGERPDLHVLKLEAPKARRLCIDLKVHGLPTFLLFEDGEEVDRISSPQLSPKELDEWLNGALERG